MADDEVIVIEDEEGDKQSTWQSGPTEGVIDVTGDAPPQAFDTWAGAQDDSELQGEQISFLPEDTREFGSDPPGFGSGFQMEEIRGGKPLNPCHTCGSTNHASKKCPEKRRMKKLAALKCHMCEGDGHMAADCPLVMAKRRSADEFDPTGYFCLRCGEEFTDWGSTITHGKAPCDPKPLSEPDESASENARSAFERIRECTLAAGSKRRSLVVPGRDVTSMAGLAVTEAGGYEGLIGFTVEGQSDEFAVCEDEADGGVGGGKPGDAEGGMFAMHYVKSALGTVRPVGKMGDALTALCRRTVCKSLTLPYFEIVVQPVPSANVAGRVRVWVDGKKVGIKSIKREPGTGLPLTADSFTAACTAAGNRVLGITSTDSPDDPDEPEEGAAPFAPPPGYMGPMAVAPRPASTGIAKMP
eukprot:Hpha_TRINITY_DN22815_c0_g1::TRINITY_DN22815_c0_g1_i1::g.84271::m.84271